MSLPRELRSRTPFGPIELRTRTPSHLISNAQPVSSAGRAPVTAFIGSSDSKATTPHFRAPDRASDLEEIGQICESRGEIATKRGITDTKSTANPYRTTRQRR